MRKIKIVADSSANMLDLGNTDFGSAPLKIIANDREFTDDKNLNVSEMVDFLDNQKGRVQSSCPNADDWLAAFGDADDIICVTITSGLSGSYNSACTAGRIYEDEHEGARVFVLDSLSAGPEMTLMVEMLEEYVQKGYEFSEICEGIQEYRQKTGLYFMLKSLKNFANNGRISPAMAKIVGFAGICIVGRASDDGKLEPTDKCRGEVRSLDKIVERMTNEGFLGGKVIISHCQNPSGAEALKALISSRYPQAKIMIDECRGLCSFYAERGGLLVGFEK